MVTQSSKKKNKKSSPSGLDKAMSPDVPVIHGIPPGTLPRLGIGPDSLPPQGFGFLGPPPSGQLSSCPPLPPKSPSVVPPSSQLSSLKVNSPPPPTNH